MSQEIKSLTNKLLFRRVLSITLCISFIFLFLSLSLATEPVQGEVSKLIENYVLKANEEGTGKDYQDFEISLYNAEPPLVPVDPSAPPIARAIQYLRNTQVTPEEEFLTNRDFAGNWPQYFFPLGFPSLRVRDISPFMPTFIHHALTLIIDENLDSLELTPAEVGDVRAIRQAAIDLMLRFEARQEDPDAGTFGFWPYKKGDLTCRDWLYALLIHLIVKGPVFMGTRAPFNLSFFPPALAIPTDADVTATVYAALLDNAQFDNGPPINTAIEQYFLDWRDLGQVPRRLNPDWLHHASGTFLTWLNYRDPPNNFIPNDVDLVVNANVLYVLARYDHLNILGVEEAISYINTATQQRFHVTRPEEVSDYYPDNFAYHYCISRAYYEGPVPFLQPAVEILADEIEQTVQTNNDGTVFWDKDDPHLNTAFAVLTLLNAGRTGPLIEAAVDYLLSEQDSTYGNWEEGIFFVARSKGGQEICFVSTALTTAIVLEALCRYKLAEHR